MSAKSKSAPQWIPALAVEQNEFGEVINLLPFFNFAIIAERCNPAEQLDTATAYLEPTNMQ